LIKKSGKEDSVRALLHRKSLALIFTYRRSKCVVSKQTTLLISHFTESGIICYRFSSNVLSYGS